MTNTNTLAMYADLWLDYPDLVPEGAVFINHDRDYIKRVYLPHCDGSRSQPIRIDTDTPEWFLALALGTLRSWLEGKGWDQSVRRDYEDNITAYWWMSMGFGSSGETGDFDCPHRAAIAAARMVKEGGGA